MSAAFQFGGTTKRGELTCGGHCAAAASLCEHCLVEIDEVVVVGDVVGVAVVQGFVAARAAVPIRVELFVAEAVVEAIHVLVERDQDYEKKVSAYLSPEGARDEMRRYRKATYSKPE